MLAPVVLVVLAINRAEEMESVKIHEFKSGKLDAEIINLSKNSLIVLNESPTGVKYGTKR